MFELKEHLLHPAISHFPVVLFLLALFMRIAQFLSFQFAPTLTQTCKLISTFLIYATAPFYLLSLFLGDMALDIIRNDICNLVQAYAHEAMAEKALIVVIVTILLEAISLFAKFKFSKTQKILEAGVLVALIAGNYLILQTAHLGGKLVFEQGAGVELPKKCQ